MSKKGRENDRIFMLGVGGMGMTPLAILLAKMGRIVDGIDDYLQDANQGILEAHYIGLCETFDLSQGYAEVIYSRAVRHDDPRLKEARENGIKVLSRGEKLAEIAAEKKLLAVVGSHGKTTTTAMLIHLLREREFNFSYMLGGLFSDASIPPAHYCEDGEYLVAEIDESDGTIDLFSPEITICLPVSWDHGAFYKDQSTLFETFVSLFERTKEHLILDESVLSLIHDKELQAKSTPLLEKKFDYQIDSSDQKIMLLKSELLIEGRSKVSSIGDFNAKNAMLALLAVQLLETGEEGSSLEKFRGVHRRQELLYQDHKRKRFIYQDYAHHPYELSTFIETVRKQFDAFTKVVIFQPHRYSRTKMFVDQFADILSTVDHGFVLPVYPASEEYCEEGISERVVEKCTKPVWLFQNDNELFEQLNNFDDDQTVFLFIGAGDIYETAVNYVDQINIDVQEIHDQSDWFEKVAHNQTFMGRISRHESLSNKVTFRLGGTARYYAEPSDESSLLLLWKAALAAQVEIFLMGRGSNLLVPDREFAGLVIRLRSKFWRTVSIQENGKIFARAGVGLRELCWKAIEMGYSDFAFMEGIPGSIGGAVQMNAGAMGGWMSQIIETVTFIDQEGRVQTKTVDELEFSYRRCNQLKGNCVLSVVLSTKVKSKRDVIKEKVQEYASQRKNSQPSEPSAGCMFKNPFEDHSGKIIDEVGLKGSSKGGISISETHGNFFVNRGNGSYQDVLSLVKETRSKIFKERGVWLEPEVQLLGSTWEEELNEE